MLFTSATFILLFLPITVVTYWALPRRVRVPFLLVASYVFYLAWDPRYGLLRPSAPRSTTRWLGRSARQ